MSQSQPRFVTFGISHYCEKARWALDWHGIAYDEINWPPGVHMVLAKSCGAKQTSLLILLDGRTVIQGSGAIIDWADRQSQDPARQLTVAAHERSSSVPTASSAFTCAGWYTPSCFRDIGSWPSLDSLAKLQTHTGSQLLRCGL
jgi:glutathione S-transferase